MVVTELAIVLLAAAAIFLDAPFLLDAWCDACRDAWNAPMAKSDVIASIGTREWAPVRIYGGWYQRVPRIFFKSVLSNGANSGSARAKATLAGRKPRVAPQS